MAHKRTRLAQEPFRCSRHTITPRTQQGVPRKSEANNSQHRLSVRSTRIHQHLRLNFVDCDNRDNSTPISIQFRETTIMTANSSGFGTGQSSTPSYQPRVATLCQPVRVGRDSRACDTLFAIQDPSPPEPVLRSEGSSRDESCIHNTPQWKTNSNDAPTLTILDSKWWPPPGLSTV
jgi:hypothetical protein